MEKYSKASLIKKLKKIRDSGWIENRRLGNSGGIGNTLEDLLGIEENNLPLPNASEWELKSQRLNTCSLTTLFHMEPSPRAFRFVPKIFLSKYGWLHQEAGKRYPDNEMSFRQTIGGKNYSDRGFKVIIDSKKRKVLITFNKDYVDERHFNWLKTVNKKIGLDELDPQPYWGYDDLFHKAGTKLKNCFYVQAEVKKEKGKEFYHYQKILMLKDLSMRKFLNALKNNDILVDFDARTGHNHGTKFRLRQNRFPNLYKTTIEY